ncbi:F0F1 ATP synthase subunit epsilon [Donghicola sp. C2-DW-16]|uniref:F0F1 ATP synthase subunit epsilon n=1 Tax=Donghicola mangrovi TaxID=2729614 RepID=A0A850QBF3_9RHOB|nr:F0F1 ATP synthase subunit epsilon [Donghicola mangrovi]NVO25682.1 F0F1 ATP synthase subunit epsilon [Donghicola mangrovi]NVO28869.1 F0F1 ATP synthase subunit epsilon [Donghicola mangrovi]
MSLILTVTTPLMTLVDGIEVASIRAEDASGSFGILPKRRDFLTVLPASVLRWRDLNGTEAYCALRSGMLRVSGGTRVDVACREGVLGDDLPLLLQHVQDLRHEQQDEERRTRVEHLRLHAQAVRQMMRFFHPERMGALSHPPAIDASGGTDA